MGDHIEFFDGPSEVSFRQEGPPLHHFRSTSITKEQELLEVSWNKCLQKKSKIPAIKLRSDLNGRWERPSVCCSINLITDPSAQDDDSSSEPQVEVEYGNLSECEDPSESDDDDDGDVEDDNDSDDNDDNDGGDDDGGDHGDDDDDGSKEGTGYFNVKTAIRRKKFPSESDMELDLNILTKQPQSESDTDMNLEPLKISSTQTQSEGETNPVDEGEGNPQPMTSKKEKELIKHHHFIRGTQREYNSKPLKHSIVKVIPLFCTAHPLLRITLRHPRWRRFYPLARKEQTWAAFAELKLLFAIIMPQIG